MIYIAVDKKSSGSGVATLVNKFAVNGDFNQNERLSVDLAMSQLAEQLHWPVIRKFQKQKVYSWFRDKIWGVYSTHMQLISKLDKGIRFLLSVINVFSQDACVVLLKDKRKV